MSALKINQNEFQRVRENEGVSLIDFYADWCGPCRMLAPTIEAIAEERSDILVAKVNVDNSPELAVRYGISSIPTVLVFKNGELKSKVVGLRSKGQLLEELDG